MKIPSGSPEDFNATSHGERSNLLLHRRTEQPPRSLNLFSSSSHRAKTSVAIWSIVYSTIAASTKRDTWNNRWCNRGGRFGKRLGMLTDLGGGRSNSPERLGRQVLAGGRVGRQAGRQAAQAKRGWLGLRFGWRVLILANLAAGWLGPRLKDEGCLPFSLSLCRPLSLEPRTVSAGVEAGRG